MDAQEKQQGLNEVVIRKVRKNGHSPSGKRT